MYNQVNYWEGVWKDRLPARYTKPFDGMTVRLTTPNYQDQINTNLLAKRARIEARLEQVDG